MSGDDQFDWNAVPDWFYWGPRAVMKFDLRSGSTPEPETDHTTTLVGDTTDGSTYDGPVIWDGSGDATNVGDVNTIVGLLYVGAATKWRCRAHYRFDVSSIPDTAAINHATLYLYYANSQGDGVAAAAPDSADVGHVIVDHIEDWGGGLVPSDFEAAAKVSDIGTLVGNDRTPDGGRWVALDVTGYVQKDISEQDPTDTSCFRLRQSLELAYALCTSGNFWLFTSANSPQHRPYLSVNYSLEGVDWTDWREAQDNREFEHTLYRYVQHRFYAWIPQDVRFSRNRKKLPQFIYRHFVLKWWGRRFRYEYRYRDEFYPFGPVHIWGYTPIIWGQYRFANDAVISPTLYDELPVFEV